GPDLREDLRLLETLPGETGPTSASPVRVASPARDDSDMEMNAEGPSFGSPVRDEEMPDAPDDAAVADSGESGARSEPDSDSDSELEEVFADLPVPLPAAGPGEPMSPFTRQLIADLAGDHPADALTRDSDAGDERAPEPVDEDLPSGPTGYDFGQEMVGSEYQEGDFGDLVAGFDSAPIPGTPAPVEASPEPFAGLEEQLDLDSPGDIAGLLDGMVTPHGGLADDRDPADFDHQVAGALDELRGLREQIAEIESVLDRAERRDDDQVVGALDDLRGLREQIAEIESALDGAQRRDDHGAGSRPEPSPVPRQPADSESLYDATPRMRPSELHASALVVEGEFVAGQWPVMSDGDREVLGGVARRVVELVGQGHRGFSLWVSLYGPDELAGAHGVMLEAISGELRTAVDKVLGVGEADRLNWSTGGDVLTDAPERNHFRWGLRLQPAQPVGPAPVVDPVPLVDLVSAESLNLSDVHFVSLVDRDGRVAGVFFPGPRVDVDEAEVVRAAFARTPSHGSYTVAGHRGGDGFRLWRRSDGALVRVEAAWVTWMLASGVLPGGQGWRQSSGLVWLRCGVADWRVGTLARLDVWARGQSYKGSVLGPVSEVEVFKDGTIRFDSFVSFEADGSSSTGPGQPYAGEGPSVVLGPDSPRSTVDHPMGGVETGLPTPPVTPLPTTDTPVRKRNSVAHLPYPALRQFEAEIDGSPPEMTELDQQRLNEMMSNEIMRQTVREIERRAMRGQVMQSLRLSVTAPAQRLAQDGPALFAVLENVVRTAVRNRGLDPDKLGLEFDHIEQETESETTTVGIFEHQTPRHSPAAYAAMTSLDVHFSIPGGRLPAADRLQLRSMVGGFARSLQPGSPLQLVLDLRSPSALFPGRAAEIAREVRSAVRDALPPGSAMTAEQVIDGHIRFYRGEHSHLVNGLFADVIRPAREFGPPPGMIVRGRNRRITTETILWTGPIEDATEEVPAGLRAAAKRIARDVHARAAAGERQSDVRLQIRQKSVEPHDVRMDAHRWVEDVVRQEIAKLRPVPEGPNFTYLTNNVRKADDPATIQLSVHETPAPEPVDGVQRLDVPFLNSLPVLAEGTREQVITAAERFGRDLLENPEDDRALTINVLDTGGGRMADLRTQEARTLVLDGFARAFAGSSNPWTTIEALLAQSVRINTYVGKKALPTLSLEVAERAVDRPTPVDYTELVRQLPVDLARRFKQEASSSPVTWEGRLDPNELRLAADDDRRKLDELAVKFAEVVAERYVADEEQLDVRLTVMAVGQLAVHGARTETHQWLEDVLRGAVELRLGHVPDGLRFTYLTHSAARAGTAVRISIFPTPRGTAQDYRDATTLTEYFVTTFGVLSASARWRVTLMAWGQAYRVFTDPVYTDVLIARVVSSGLANVNAQVREVESLIRAAIAAVRAEHGDPAARSVDDIMREFVVIHPYVLRNRNAVLLDTGPLTANPEEAGNEHGGLSSAGRAAQGGVTRADRVAGRWTLPHEVTEPANEVTGIFHTLDQDTATLSGDVQLRVEKLGQRLAGEVAQLPSDAELPDVRIFVRSQVGPDVPPGGRNEWNDPDPQAPTVRKTATAYLTELLHQQLDAADVDKATVDRLPITWLFKQGADGYDGRLSIRYTSASGLSKDHYRDARELHARFVPRRRAMLPTIHQQQMFSAAEGFVARCPADPAAQFPTLLVDIGRPSEFTHDRVELVGEFLRQAITAAWHADTRRGKPPLETVLDHLKVGADPDLREDLRLLETLPGETGPTSASPVRVASPARDDSDMEMNAEGPSFG
ncbi:hypothetical protein, partial [Amycolatopsis panacis]